MVIKIYLTLIPILLVSKILNVHDEYLYNCLGVKVLIVIATMLAGTHFLQLLQLR